jgi:hypothetical protein
MIPVTERRETAAKPAFDAVADDYGHRVHPEGLIA